MSGAITSLPQYAFMALCLVKAQGHLYLYNIILQYTTSAVEGKEGVRGRIILKWD